MKKVKLFTTIASLCLAVALMAFGVYAAQNALKHTVSGNITYQSTDIAGTWDILVETGEGAVFAEGETGVYNGLTAEADGKTEDVDLAIAKNAEEATFTVKATFKNSSTTAGVLTYNFANVLDQAAYKIEYSVIEEADKAIEAGAEGTASVTVQVKVTMKVLTASVDEMPWSVAFTATASELA